MRFTKKLTAFKLKSMAAIFVAFFTVIGVSANAGPADIKLMDLIQDTQKMEQTNESMVLVWWIPTEFFEANFAQDKSISDAEAQEFLKVIEPYTIVVVIDAKISKMGAVSYKSRDEIIENVVVTGMDGKAYKAIPKADMQPDAANFLDLMKPLMANMMGQMGNNMQFLAFSTAKKNGSAIANPKESGSFIVKVGSDDFKWNLPLGSVLTSKVCPEDGAEMSGAWTYCPFHGTKLK